jgi:hypothetical protein
MNIAQMKSNLMQMDKGIILWIVIVLIAKRILGYMPILSILSQVHIQGIKESEDTE